MKSFIFLVHFGLYGIVICAPSIVNECSVKSTQCPNPDGPDSVYIPLEDCTKFCQCSNGEAILHSCPKGFHFNPTLNVCDWPQNAGCEQPENPTTSIPTITSSTGTTSNADKCANILECDPECGTNKTVVLLDNCSEACECSDGVVSLITCSEGLHYNIKEAKCDWPELAHCEPTTTTSIPSTTTLVPVTTPAGDKCTDILECDQGCGSNKTIVLLDNCSEACECSDGVLNLITCSEGLHYNIKEAKCDWPELANCEPTTTTSTLSTTTPVPVTTPGGDKCSNVLECNPNCGTNKTVILLDSCSEACECSDGVLNLITCSEGLHYNIKEKKCDWPENANCEIIKTTTPLPVTSPDEDKCSNVLECDPECGTNKTVVLLDDCSEACECSDGVLNLITCSEGLHYNIKEAKCDWPELANCEPTTTTSTLSTTTPVPVTTPGGDKCSNVLECNPNCGTNKTVILLDSCSEACECSDGVLNLITCSEGLHYNIKEKKCDWPENANCEIIKTTTPLPVTSPDEDKCSNVLECDPECGTNKTVVLLDDCSEACECSDGVLNLITCSEGLHYNIKEAKCDWPELANCESTTTTSTLSTTTPVPVTTPGGDKCSNVLECNPNCGTNKTVILLDSCSEACECSDGVLNLITCSEGLHYNIKEKKCDWPENANCEIIKTTTPLPVTSPDEDKCSNVLECDPECGTNKTVVLLDDCSEACECSDGVLNLITCSEGLHYNIKEAKCDWPELANCEPTTTTSTPSTTTTVPATTPSDDKCSNILECDPECGTNKTVVLLDNCSEACECSGGILSLITCSNGLHYNVEEKKCDWPEQANCEPNKITTTPSTNPTTLKPVNECSSKSSQCPFPDGPDSVYIPLDDCTKFCQCSNGQAILHRCPGGLHFNPVLNVCDWPKDAGCDQQVKTTTSTSSTTTTNAPNTTSVTATTSINSTSATPSKVVCLGREKYCPAVDDEFSVYIPLPDCTKFCECSNGTPYEFDCPSNLHFNPDLNVCDYPERAGCTGLGIFHFSFCDCQVNREAAMNIPIIILLGYLGILEAATLGRDHSECYSVDQLCPLIDRDKPFYITLPDSTKYCLCSHGYPQLYICPNDLHFNPETALCELPENTQYSHKFKDVLMKHHKHKESKESDSKESDSDSHNHNNEHNSNSKENHHKGSHSKENDSDSHNHNHDHNSKSKENHHHKGSHSKESDSDSKESDSGSHNHSHEHNSNSKEHHHKGSHSKESDSDSQESDSSSMENQSSESSSDSNESDSDSNTSKDSDSSASSSSESGSDSNDSENSNENNESKETTSTLDPVTTSKPASTSQNTESTVPSTAKPITTQTPTSSTQKTITPTEKPLTTSKPVTTSQNPETTSAITTTQKPVTSSKSPTTSQNTETSAPGTTSGPVPSSPVTSQPPITTKQPNPTSLPDKTTTNIPTTPQRTTTVQPEDECFGKSFQCPNPDGPDSVYIPLEDCTKFCQCSNGIAILHKCPEGLHFNPVLNVCDWSQDAGCQKSDVIYVIN
ncbi:zonadhesin [Aethina tumida]|uniref:zonadhesin n=1 Tax=Aethina tumida TaxID=116153 RepID=UPI002148DF5B|nr:zonadhesin [Aethina tumida]